MNLPHKKFFDFFFAFALLMGLGLIRMVVLLNISTKSEKNFSLLQKVFLKKIDSLCDRPLILKKKYVIIYTENKKKIFLRRRIRSMRFWLCVA